MSFVRSTLLAFFALLIGLASVPEQAGAMIAGPVVPVAPRIFSEGELTQVPTTLALICWGQSPCTGVMPSAQQTAVSCSQHGHVMFGSGVKSMAPDNIFVIAGVGPPLNYPEPSGPGTTTISPGTTTLIPLCEDLNYAWAPSTTEVAGETALTAGVDTVSNKAIALASGYNDNNVHWFASTPARGGEQIVTLIPGSTNWLNMKAHLKAFIALSIAAGRRPDVAAMPYFQGEADAQIGTSYATYKANLDLIVQGIVTETQTQMAAVGLVQTNPPFTIIDQISHKTGNTGGPIARAQCDEAKEHPTQAFLIPPDYMFDHTTDNLHFTQPAQDLYGFFNGRAAFNVLFNTGISGTQTGIVLQSATFYAASSQILASFTVPNPPLRLANDNLHVGGADWQPTPQRGLHASDDSGNIALSTIKVIDDGSSNHIGIVGMVAARAPTTNAEFDVGLTYTSPSNTLGLAVGGTNSDLKDTNPETFTPPGVGSPTYHTWNWANHCQVTLNAA